MKKKSNIKVSSTKKLDIQKLSAKVKKYLPNFDEDKFTKAFEFAKKAHEGQFRKDNKTPYVAHPFNVAEILTDFHADEDTLISTLLHDVPEDTKYTIDDVKKLFGEKVSFLVDGITKLSKVYYKNNMPERQVNSLKKLFLHSAEDLRVILIKLADRFHNMQTLKYIPEEHKRIRIARETLEIYVPIADLLGIQELKYQLEDLCFQNLFPEDYDYVYKKRKRGYKDRKESAKKIIQILEEECKKQNLEAKISDRKKNLYAIYKKVYFGGKISSNIDNRLSLKFVVDNVSDCYKALGIIHNRFIPKIDRFRDYIATPKSNGYKSLHTMVFGLDGILTEIQIRTEEMDLEASYGVAAGFFLKNKINSEQQRVAWVKRILEIEKKGEKSQDFIENLKIDVFQKRIFVFTPTGKTVDLPKGATVLDFAYAIHTELGHHIVKAYVNNEEKKINDTLRTGDVVRIVTSSKSTPDVEWLSFVKTSNARNKILTYLKRISNDKKIMEGKKILQKELDVSGLGLLRNINFKKLSKSMEVKSNQYFQDMESLLRAVGSGKLKASDVIKHLNFYERNKPVTYSDKRLKKVHKDGLRITLKIIAKNRAGLMQDITQVIYRHALFIYNFKCEASRHDREAFFSVDIFVDDFSVISNVFNELYQVQGISSVYKVSRKALFTISVASVVTAFIWISHPIFFHFMAENTWIPINSFFGKIITYGSLFVLSAAVIYLTSIFRTYFPYIRHRKRLHIISFLVPLFATLTLVAEILYFKTKLNLTIILIQIFLIYVYLFINLVSLKKSIWKT
jgi:GTP diphosphokinase / guanosine-3',5'-bis(diphosphate) 3'-diphosphatase